MSVYILHQLSLKALPDEAQLKIKRLPVPRAMMWAHTQPCINCVPKRNKVAEISRSFAPLEDKPPKLGKLRPGDQALVLLAPNTAVYSPADLTPVLVEVEA